MRVLVNQYVIPHLRRENDMTGYQRIDDVYDEKISRFESKVLLENTAQATLEIAGARAQGSQHA